jgi:hypothetical protein
LPRLPVLFRGSHQISVSSKGRFLRTDLGFSVIHPQKGRFLRTDLGFSVIHPQKGRFLRTDLGFSVHLKRAVFEEDLISHSSSKRAVFEDRPWIFGHSSSKRAFLRTDLGFRPFILKAVFLG